MSLLLWIIDLSVRNGQLMLDSVLGEIVFELCREVFTPVVRAKCLQSGPGVAGTCQDVDFLDLDASMGFCVFVIHLESRRGVCLAMHCVRNCPL